MNRSIINLLPDLTLISSCLLAFAASKLPLPYTIQNPLFKLFGIVLLITGVATGIYILSILKKRKTSTNAADEPAILINDGAFSISRNPYYLASLTAIIGFSLILGSIVSFIAPVMYFAIINFHVIPIEERILLKTFGEEYLIYKKSTRRWV